mmetsp:Transcript_22734/g.34695  ORF Transcript_22734/g.34695 Transcript_22734/m.34695 type:complete len:985 (-) Transcript_22734:36-2990(-)
MNHRSITPSTNIFLSDDSKMSATPMLKVAGVGVGTVDGNKTVAAKMAPPNDPLTERSRRLAKELEEFVERGMQGILATERGDAGAPSIDAATELQIQIGRMFRQIFPGNRELLYLISEKNWMGLLLQWMNQYDRPKVQVEAMLSLTTITDLCQQQCYQNLPAGGVEISPFSTGIDTSVHGSFRRPGMGQNKAQRDGLNKSNVKNKGGSIADRVKNIMNQAKETNSSMRVSSGMKDKMSQSISPISGTGTDAGEPQSIDTSTNTIPPASIMHSSGQNQSNTNKPPNDAYFKQIFQRQESLENGTSAKSSQAQLPFSNHNSNANNLSRTGPPGPPRPPQNLLSRLPNPIQLNGDSSKIDLPGLSPAILSALNSSFQNLPTSLPTTAGSSPIPLAGNYTQPLSVTSNNLLVRHPEAIPSFISLMTSPDKDVAENAMWVVGNIAAGEGPGVPGSGMGGSNASSLGEIGDKSPNVTVKDIVLAAGAMGPLLRCMERFHDSLSLQRIGSWVISTLVETKMPPGKKNASTTETSRIEDIDLEQLLNTQRRLIKLDDGDILSYTCWALSHLCDGPASNIAAVVTSLDLNETPGGLVPRLVELLHHNNWRVTKPALRTIGNIVCAEYDEDLASSTDVGKSSNSLTDFTEVILECDAVPRLKSLINHANREIQKEACWTLSNIAAGTVDQIQAVIDSGAIPPLVNLVGLDGTDQEVRSEACWVVLNATSCGSDSQIGVLVSEGCVSVLGLLMEETNMVTMALEGLERVLQVEEAREATWRENQKIADPSGQDIHPPSPLVHPSLIEKALNKKNSVAVLKRAKKIWHDHFVECALCNMPYSKHRVTDAKFCEECKCHVCTHCNCEIYHLSYQEELFSEDIKAVKSKKSKNKKKKEKRKNKSKAQEMKSIVQKDAQKTKSDDDNLEEKSFDPDKNDCEADVREEMKNTEKSQHPIDFSFYLQQTGSIIALARLMDALDEGNGFVEEFDHKSLRRNQ